MRCISRGEGIRTPGPMLPKHVRYQTALHPGFPCRLHVVRQATCYILLHRKRNVNPFFELFSSFFETFLNPLILPGLRHLSSARNIGFDKNPRGKGHG